MLHNQGKYVNKLELPIKFQHETLQCHKKDVQKGASGIKHFYWV